MLFFYFNFVIKTDNCSDFSIDRFLVIYAYCDVCFAPQLHSYKPDDNRLPFS